MAVDLAYTISSSTPTDTTMASTLPNSSSPFWKAHKKHTFKNYKSRLRWSCISYINSLVDKSMLLSVIYTDNSVSRQVASIIENFVTLMPLSAPDKGSLHTS